MLAIWCQDFLLWNYLQAAHLEVREEVVIETKLWRKSSLGSSVQRKVIRPENKKMPVTNFCVVRLDPSNVDQFINELIIGFNELKLRQSLVNRRLMVLSAPAPTQTHLKFPSHWRPVVRGATVLRLEQWIKRTRLCSKDFKMFSLPLGKVVGRKQKTRKSKIVGCQCT